MPHWAILDTNVYIGHWERSLYGAELDAIRRAFLIRQSSVVLSELRRGARTPGARRLVEALRHLAPVQWEPLAEDWWEAARLIQKIGDAQNWEVGKRRESQNDALIALTARRYGAAVVTAKGTDFKLLQREIRIHLLTLQAHPTPA